MYVNKHTDLVSECSAIMYEPDWSLTGSANDVLRKAKDPVPRVRLTCFAFNFKNLVSFTLKIESIIKGIT